MNTVKRLVQVVTVLLLVAVLTCSVFATRQQGQAGGYTAVTTLTERSREWIIENFGDCVTLQELMLRVDLLATREFVYVDKFYVQHFVFDQFVFEDNFHGLCFDFACFMKCVVLVWSEYRGVENVRAYVVCVDLPDNVQHHAYNLICDEQTTYYTDLTVEVSRAKAGKKLYPFTDIGNVDFHQYAAKYGEKILALQ